MTTPHSATAYPTDHLYIDSPAETAFHEKLKYDLQAENYRNSFDAAVAQFATLAANSVGRAVRTPPVAPDAPDAPAPPLATPGDSWTKDQIIVWLGEQGVTATSSSTKAELLDMVRNLPIEQGTGE